MVEVRDKNNAVRCRVEITDKCVYSKTLMEDEYVLLSFESDTLIGFQKKDSIKTEFGTFRIKDITKPQPQTDGGYLYEQKFVPDWVFWKNRILFYNRQLGSEKAWKMTQRPEYFMDIVVRNIQDAGFGRYSFEIDETLTEMKLVEFDSTNIIDALTAIAEAWETEWWITDNIIHISKCEFGSPISLTEGDELGDIGRDDGQDTTYLTRAYVFGSTRNLPKNYRKNDDGTVVVEGIVETRLKLPANIPYVDAWEGMKEEDIVEGVIVLDDVYPRNVGTISKITTKKYTDKIEDEDGTTTYEDWNAFRFTDNTLPHFSKDYVLADQELHIIFQTGKLAGMDFAVTFNPDAESEKDPASQIFEIVRNEDYGVALPTDTFKPEEGDTYILYGYDTTYVYDNLVTKAEQELYEKAIEKVADASKDKSVYTCQTNPLRCAGYKPNGIGKMIHATADEIDLDMGQSVTLRSTNLFESGCRLSRVRGFEKRLDNKYNCTYTIGESSIYSRNADLQEQVDELTYQSKQFVNVYGNSVYVVKRYDTTAPSDNNVPSFKRAQYEFLQRNVPNRATKKISFDEGVEIGNFTQGEEGGLIDGKGNAELLSLVVRSLVQSSNFAEGGTNGAGWRIWTDGAGRTHFVADEATVREMLHSPVFYEGLTGSGWKIWQENGVSRLETDRLTVRQSMTVFELLIEKVRSTGGEIVASPANGKIGEVSECTQDGTDYYMIGFEQGCQFMPGDLVRCQTFTGTGMKSYWVEVSLVSRGYAYVEQDEFTAWGCTPEVGDECVLMGNTADTERQNAVSIRAAETGRPTVSVYDGIDGRSLEGHLRARLGYLGDIHDDWFSADRQPDGYGLYSDNAYLRGRFVLESGDDVRTLFSVVEGKIQGSVEALREDVDDGGFLNNAGFNRALRYWTTGQQSKELFMAGTAFIWANGRALSNDGGGVGVVSEDGRNAVHIVGTYIEQSNGNLKSRPVTSANTTGEKKPVPVYFSMVYRCVSAGILRVVIRNEDKSGYETYGSLLLQWTIAATDEWTVLSGSGYWNGTGDFRLTFTGDIYIRSMILGSDAVEALTYMYRGFFEQSAKLTAFGNLALGADGSVLASSGIVTAANFSDVYAISGIDAVTASALQTALGGYVEASSFSAMFAAAADEQGLVKQASISAMVTKDGDGYISNARVAADRIQLEGLVTVNGNVRINTDGTLYARNAVVEGYLKEGAISLFANGNTEKFSYVVSEIVNIYATGRDYDIYLPSDPEFIGARITVVFDRADPDNTGYAGSSQTNRTLRLIAGRTLVKHAYLDADGNVYDGTGTEGNAYAMKQAFIAGTGATGYTSATSCNMWFLGAGAVAPAGVSGYYYPTILSVPSGSAIQLMGVASNCAKGKISRNAYEINGDYGVMVFEEDGSGNAVAKTTGKEDEAYTGELTSLCQWAVVSFQSNGGGSYTGIRNDSGYDGSLPLGFQATQDKIAV